MDFKETTQKREGCYDGDKYTSISKSSCKFLHDAANVSDVAYSKYQSLFFIRLLNLWGFLSRSLWNLTHIAASCNEILIVICEITVSRRLSTTTFLRENVLVIVLNWVSIERLCERLWRHVVVHMQIKSKAYKSVHMAKKVRVNHSPHRWRNNCWLYYTAVSKIPTLIDHVSLYFQLLTVDKCWVGHQSYYCSQ